MTWEVFYLICFIVGLVLSALSLLGGLGHIGHFGHIGGHVHVPHLPHGGAPHTAAWRALAPGGACASCAGLAVPWWNSFSLMIFLCWFGAAGYVLTRHGSFVAMVVLVFSLIAGLTGGTIVFLFLAKVMLPHERELTADETAVAGVVGVVSSPIRADGRGRNHLRADGRAAFRSGAL